MREAIARCDREIADLKSEARKGNPDVEGIMLGLHDWRAEEQMIYEEFLRQKRLTVKPAGFNPTSPLNRKLFAFQSDIVRWALKKGKCALFEDCGLGKTAQQLEWARHICAAHNARPVLIFAPLAAGIGSEGYVALKNGRRFIGVELKESYWKQARLNLMAAENATQPELFIA